MIRNIYSQAVRFSGTWLHLRTFNHALWHSSRTIHAIFLNASRVENWRSNLRLYLQFPLVKPDSRFSRIRLSNHLLPEAFAFAWHSGIVSSGDPGITGVYSVAAISFPSLLRKHDEGIAPSLSQSYVVFEIVSVQYEQLRLPYQPDRISFPYIHQLPSEGIGTGLPCSLSYGFPCMPPLSPRESIYRLR